MRLFALLVIAILSATALSSVVDIDRWTIGVTASPFGWQRLIFVHCFASITLSWLIAEELSRLASDSSRRVLGLIFALTAMGIVAATVLVGARVAYALDSHTSSRLTRLLVRSLWPASIQTPTYLAFLLLGGERTAIRYSRPVLIANFTLVLSVAVIVPFAYVIPLVAEQGTLADTLMDNQETARARRILQRLHDSGGTRSFSFVDANTGRRVQLSIDEALTIQEREIDRRHQRIFTLQKSPATLANRHELADHLVALEEIAEAKRVLNFIASSNSRAAMKLGKLLQQDGNWLESTKWLRRCLDQIENASSDAEDNSVIQSNAYTALAHNARQLKQYDEVERILLQAIERLPDRAAHFHAQLADHFEDGGRKFEARKHNEQAFELSPDDHPLPPNYLVLWAVLPVAVVAYLLLQDFVLA